MKIYEIGVGNPSICRTANEFENECWLFEANPDIYNQLVATFGNRPNFKIINCAIGDEDGTAKLYMDGDSSYVNGVMSPTVQCAPQDYINNLNQKEIECKKISHFDNGDIDSMLLDMEGSEWFVLKHLKSRPKYITIEIQSHDKKYINPYFNEIKQWFVENDYVLHGRNDLKEDWTFINTKKRENVLD